MFTKRSSNRRADRDISLQDNVGGAGDSKRRISKVDALFPKEFHSKDTANPQITDKGVEDGLGRARSNDLPAYEGDEYARRASAAITTAEDLVTRVINVEDDPSLNPWTFRTFFLGTSQDGALRCDNFIRLGINTIPSFLKIT